MSVPPPKKNATRLSEVNRDSHGRNKRNHFLLRLRKGILVGFVLTFLVANLVPLWSNDELNSGVSIYRANFLTSLPLPIPMELAEKNSTTQSGNRQQGDEPDHGMPPRTKEALTVVKPICEISPWPVVPPSQIYYCGHNRFDLFQFVYPEFASLPREMG